MLTSVAKWFERKQKTGKSIRRQAVRKATPAVEALEDRQLLSGATATMLSGGVLRVVGSEQADNILVQNYGTHTLVFDGGVAIFGVPSQAVNSISIDARDGDDRVQVLRLPVGTSDPYWNYIYNYRPIPTTIDGGYGNDTLIGSNYDASTLSGGFGNDTINGGNGRDTLDGGYGDDTLSGGNGNDTLNGSYGTDTLSGGDGNDTLDGSFGDDILNGGNGNDTLYGSYDDDTLDGGAGDDYLDGGFDNDLLRGGAGNDQLYGSYDHDTLYGGSGNDQLHGGSGNDGLFGGGGVDSLYGEAGADRLLVWNSYGDLAYHIVNNPEPADAVIYFWDTYQNNNTSASGVTGTMTYAAKSWTEAEIEEIDRSLSWLHQLTNNTALLKTSTGTELSFKRFGTYLTTGISFGATVYGWNLGGGAMGITNYGFSNGDEELDLTIIHEVAHNWDDESAVWTRWRNLSGWVARPTSSTAPGAGQSVSGDGLWFYNSTAPFYNTASRRNPMEDWAWTFEAYYRQQQGTLSAATATRLQPKFDLIEEFLAGLNT